jgi:hypothetical protein
MKQKLTFDPKRYHLAMGHNNSYTMGKQCHMQQFRQMKMAGTFVHLQLKIDLFCTVQPIAYMYQFSMHKVFLVNATFNIQAIASLNTNENEL